MSTNNNYITRKRFEGQVWIDKNSPYKLKYHVNEKDFIVETSATYHIDYNNIEADEDGVLLHAGTVVALDGNLLKKAEFPLDIKKVLGVALSDVFKYNQKDPLAVIQTGYLELQHPEHLFTENDLSLNTTSGGKHNFYTKSTIEGAPVYWDSAVKSTSGDVSRPGLLTLKTPAGYPRDPALQVGYDNLPQVGTVVSVVTKNNKINKMFLHINFTSFDSSIEWTWPLKKSQSGTDLGEFKPSIDNTSNTFTIEHKLTGSLTSTSKCFVDILAIDAANNKEYVVHADVSNDYDVGATSVTINTPETLIYRVNGRVTYNFC